MLGDFNYDLLKHDKNPYVTKFVETLSNYSLQPTINKPTRVVKKQNPSILDNIFTNAIDKDIVTGNLVDKISDHMPNFILMKNMVFNHKKIHKKTRSFQNFDATKYNEDVGSIDLLPVIMNNFDANEAYTFYQTQLVNIMNKHAPFITLTNTQLKWKQKPWISRRLQNLITEKGKLYNRFLSRNKDPFWYNRYNMLKKSLEKNLRKAKSEYFKKFFEHNMNNSRKIWKGINEIISNKGTNDSEIYLDEDGSILTNPKKIANKFNKFYTNIAENLLKNLGNTPTKYQDYLKNPNEHSMYFNETDPGEVSKIISTLDISKAGDLHGISPKLLKYAPSMAFNLSLIFNMCVEQGIFPHQLKVAKVIPVHKADSKMVMSNYRPISLIPIIGKIFEKIIFERIYSFINKHKILYNKQYGFQRGKSTELALIDI